MTAGAASLVILPMHLYRCDFAWSIPVLVLHQKHSMQAIRAVPFIPHAWVAYVCTYVCAGCHARIVSACVAAFLFQPSWNMLACLPSQP